MPATSRSSGASWRCRRRRSATGCRSSTASMPTARYEAARHRPDGRGGRRVGAPRLPAEQHGGGRAAPPRDGARPFRAHRGRDRPADHPVPVPGRDRARLSVRDAAAGDRGGADDPGGEGLVRRSDAARAHHPHPAGAAAAGDAADDAQRLADELARHGRERAPLRRRQRRRRPAGGAVRGRQGQGPRGARRPSTTASTRCSRPSTRRRSSTCTTA